MIPNRSNDERVLAGHVRCPPLPSSSDRRLHRSAMPRPLLLELPISEWFAYVDFSSVDRLLGVVRDPGGAGHLAQRDHSGDRMAKLDRGRNPSYSIILPTRVTIQDFGTETHDSACHVPCLFTAHRLLQSRLRRMLRHHQRPFMPGSSNRSGQCTV